MTLLLKTNSHLLPTCDNRLTVTVSKQKSDKSLDMSNINSEVFIWVTNSGSVPGHLESKAKLVSVSDTEAPQKRNPSKFIQAYLLELEPLYPVRRRLTTDDLLPYRNSPIDSPMHLLGKIHKDRNEKINRIDEETIKILNSYF